MLKSISILIAFILQVFIHGQSNLINTNGPFTNDITSYLAYTDSLVFLYKKDIGLFKSTNLGNSWSKVLSGIPRNENIISITRHPNGYLFAASTSGGVLRSTDGGESWLLTPSSQLGVVKCLFAKSNGLIFAATENQGLFRSNNLGNNWTQLHSSYTTDVMAESTSGNLFMIYSSTICRSTDDGMTWNFGMYTYGDRKFLTADNFNAIYLASFRYIYRSTNQGASWQSLYYFFLGNTYTSLAVTTDSLIFTSMDNLNSSVGGIARSTDYGANFSSYSMYGQNVQKMFIVNDQYLFVSRPDGLFRNNFRISNQFTQVDSDLELPIISNMININAGTSIVAICDSGGLFKYYGGSWGRLYKDFPVNTSISTVYVASSFQLIGTKNDGLWRSNDNGINWAQLNIFPQINSDVVVIESADNALIYCATKYDGIFVTTNGGINWQSSNTGLPETFVVEDMEVTNSGVCYVSLLNEGVYFSLDTGNTWYPRKIGLPSNTTIISLSSRGNYLLGATQSNGIYLSSNFGESWFSVSGGLPSTLSNPIVKYHSSGIAYIASERTIYKSNDFGVNWVPNYTVPQGVKILSLAFDSYSTLYAGCDDGRVYKSRYTVLPVELSSFIALKNNSNIELLWSTETELNNHGFEIERSPDKTTWATIGFKEGKGTTTEPNQYFYSDDISELALRKLFYRLKQIDFNGSFEYSDVVEVEIDPSKFSLEQNFPNPFNPSTKISWQSPVSSWQTLKVYDVLGKEVATLVNEYRNAGSYDIDFDATQFTSGIYFYQLKAGEFVETKKMLIIK